jgi:diphosphomevalonate decarboxylase
MSDEIYTASGSPNIALIKYWGRRDDLLNLPNNSSISMTLGDGLTTTTSVMFSDRIKEDAVYINGKRQDYKAANDEKSGFMLKAIEYMREAAKTNARLLAVSKNSFPSDAGLASSASGAATMVYALNEALGLKMQQKELSIVARQISGSACRSIFGGIVKWNKGSRSDGSDSFAEQVVPADYWPDLVDIIAIVSESKKKVSSSEGHKVTVRTSALYRARPPFAEAGVAKVIEAVHEKDFNSLAELIMRDSNDMHATMLDSWPPIIYLNDASKGIIGAIHEINQSHGENMAAYTFDAGPNGHIITLRKYEAEVTERLSKAVGIKSIITSGIGSGPRKSEDCLITKELLAENERQ